MRILAVSDTHGRCEGIIKEVKNREKFDLLFHLGDYVEDGDKIAQELDIPAVIVRGNGDFYSHYQDEELVEFSGKTIFLTHGHMYNVRFDISNLYYRGRELGADLILFGHTHVPLNMVENGIRILNPGSPVFPRSIDKTRSYGIIEIQEDIKTEIITI